MRKSGKGKRSNVVSKVRNDEILRSDRKMKEDVVADLVQPGRSQDETVFVRSDLSMKLMKMLLPYNTIGNQTIRLRAPYTIANITQSNTVNVFGAINFQVSLYPGFTSAAAFFDMYLIEAVHVSFAPMYFGSYFVNGSLNPRLFTVIDYDDSVTPTSIGYLQSYDSCVTSHPENGVTRILRPRIAVAAYSSSFASNKNEPSGWIDAATPNVQHYGVKYGIEVGAGGQTTVQSYSIDVVLYLKLRSVR
jgi:hypothetical protein